MELIGNVIIFIVGAAVGGAGVWFYYKRQFIKGLIVKKLTE